jgi:tetratricopeptide (TPR) repeat protein
MRAAADWEDEAEPRLLPDLGPDPIMPARELLGELLLQMGDPGAARVEFEASLRTEPNRFRGIYGAATAAELSGDRDAALAYYAQLLELAARADTDRPELQHAQAFLAR